MSTDPNSAEGRQLQHRLEALGQIKLRLELQKQVIGQEMEPYQEKLSNNIENCDPEIQQLISSYNL